MLTTYRRVLDPHDHPGAWLFSLTGVVARLPISMVGLGIVVMVEAASGSYAVAGSVSAVYLLANAVLAVVQGRLLDALGQGRVLAAASGLFGVAMVLLVWSVQAGWPDPGTYVAAALAGATLPQVTSAVRARWTHVLEAPAELQTAFALEAVLDEVVFTIGPVVVTVLAASVHPAAGLVAAVVAGVGGSLAFAAQRGTAPPPHPPRQSTDVRPRLPVATLVPLAAGCAALGVLFGAAEVTTVAFADERGHPAWAGGLLALWAIGSLLAGAVTGALTWRVAVVTRLRRGALAMAAAMAPLALVGSLPLMGLVLLVGGAAIAPTMIAAITLTEQRTPSSRLTEGLAVVQTAIIIGVAPGAAAAGWVIDHAGPSTAYLVSLGAGLVAAAATLLVPGDQPAAVDAPEGADLVG